MSPFLFPILVVFKPQKTLVPYLCERVAAGVSLVAAPPSPDPPWVTAFLFREAQQPKVIMTISSNETHCAEPTTIGRRHGMRRLPKVGLNFGDKKSMPFFQRSSLFRQTWRPDFPFGCEGWTLARFQEKRFSHLWWASLVHFYKKRLFCVFVFYVLGLCISLCRC